MTLSHGIASTLILALALNSVGCGGGRKKASGPSGTVKGKVTYEGNPVTEGTVSFMSQSGASGTGQLGAGGVFTIQSAEGGLPVGTYAVGIRAPLVEDKGDGTSPPQMVLKKMDNLPEKYAIPETSGLTAEVKEGANDFTFQMTP